MRGTWQDLKFALRGFLRSPGFVLVAVVTLALGIGANAAIFSVVDATILRPLPYPDADRLLHLGKTRDPARPGNASMLDFVDWRQQASTLDEVAAFHEGAVTMTGVGDRPERLDAVIATANIFTSYGVQPVLGRGFAPGEDTAGNNRVAVLTHATWQRWFHGDKGVLGRTITLDGTPHTVIGVLPASFRQVGRPRQPDVWVPIPDRLDVDMMASTKSSRGGHYLTVIGRLRPGVELATARAELATIQAQLAAAHPDANKARFLIATPLKDLLISSARPALLILLGAVGFVLLVACANVANLSLARANSRRRELAIRVALGASRARVIRQMLTESLLLAVLGGGAGVVVALWGLDALRSLVPAHLAGINEIAIDGRVLAFTSGLSVLTGLLCGLLPAIQASKRDPQEALQAAAAHATAGAGRQRVRTLLIAAEIAVAMLLLTGAGLTMKSFSRVSAVDPGFDPSDLMIGGVSLPRSRYDSNEKIVAFARDLDAQLANIPGVHGAAVGVPLPFSNSNISFRFTIEGQPPPEVGKDLVASFRAVTSSYFATMKLQLKSGRLLRTTDDEAHAAKVVVVSDTLARRHFPSEDPLGKRIVIGFGDKPEAREIVGVVADVRYAGLDVNTSAEMYAPFAQLPLPFIDFVVRTTARTGIAPSIKAALAAVDPGLPLGELDTMDSNMRGTLASRRLGTLLLGIFGGLALALALIGVYGVTAYNVGQRRREIGIRLALGARPRDVIRGIVGHGVLTAVAGVAAGTLAAIPLSSLLSSLLYGVTGTDPTIYVAVAGLLIGVAALASWIPARRAASVDPMLALRTD